MESVLAIGVGLGLRMVVDAATDDHKVGGVLVGLWEGVVLNHFVRKMPRSFDPYIALAFRVFVDFLFTQSLSRMALVALWTVVGMLLADIAPSIWRDSGLRRLYRRVRREARHVKRAIPDIRIKNDIPRVRIFSHRHRESSPASIRSDRAAPAQSPPPGMTPMPGPRRRPSGRNPPGTFPGSSGWSETETEVTTLRARVVGLPGPSPSLIPTRVDAQLQHLDVSDVPGPGARSTSLVATEAQNQTILLETCNTQTNAVSELINPIDDPSNCDPPAIPDDWVDITPPLQPQLDQPAVPLLADLQELPSPIPRLPTPPRPSSVVEPTPRISTIPDMPDVDPKGDNTPAPHQIPLPGSRAATVIGGVEEHSISVRNTLIARMEKAGSELGVDPLRPLAPYPPVVPPTAFSKLKHSLTESTVDGSSEVKLAETASVAGGQTNVLNADHATTTPTQVDPPPQGTALNTPVDARPPPLAKSEMSVLPPAAQDTPADGGNADSSPGPSSDNTNVIPSQGTGYLDPDPADDPPPPFSEVACGEGGAAPSGPVTQDEQATELSGDQKAAEEKRQRFLREMLEKRQSERDKLQMNLGNLSGKENKRAPGMKSKLDELQGTLDRLQARLSKKSFSGTQTPIVEVKIRPSNGDLVKDVSERILEELLLMDNAGPVSFQVTLPKKVPKFKVETLQEFISKFDFPSSTEKDTMTIIV
ncbi:hypothetical protein BKA82DRAFT_4059663 [Pisolithus tinctorius]|nr:hypothetical protein BKA82DRAFT_4059663 [Pisolithus tinctorius]